MLRLNINIHIWTIFFCLSFGNSFGQCKEEFTITELENICSYSYDELESFITKKGYRIYETSKDYKLIVGGCKAPISSINGLMVSIGKSVKILNITYGSKIILQAKSNGYNIRSSTGGVTNFSKEKFYAHYLSAGNVTEVEITKSSRQSANRIDKDKLGIESNTTTTDITVKKGDKINLRAQGSIVLGVFAGSGSPDGISGLEGYSKVSRFKHGSLIGKIGNGEWFLVGSYASIVAQNAGTLILQVNDNDPSNNEGSFIVEYGINKEISKPAPNYQPKQSSTNSSPMVNNEPLPIKKKDEILYEDDFSMNKGIWKSSLTKHSFTISNHKMIYDNQEKKDGVSYVLNAPLALADDNDYMVEVDMQTLTPCENKEVFISLKNSGYNYFGFSVGSQESDITFLVGSEVQVREMRDATKFTCFPAFTITNMINNNITVLQNWTRNRRIAEGSNINALKIIKKGGYFNFYVNDALISTKKSYRLTNNGNSITLVTSSKSKVAIHRVKVTLLH